jgi:acetyl-CoA synthetase
MDEYKEQYRKSIEQPEEFWAGVADHFLWRKKFSQLEF